MSPRLKLRLWTTVSLLGFCCMPAQAQLSDLKGLAEKARQKKVETQPAAVPERAQGTPGLPSAMPQTTVGELFLATGPMELGPDGKPRLKKEGRITTQFKGGEWVYGLLVLREPLKKAVGQASGIADNAWAPKETLAVEGELVPSLGIPMPFPRKFIEQESSAAQAKALSVAVFVPTDQAGAFDISCGPEMKHYFLAIPSPPNKSAVLTFKVRAGSTSRAQKPLALAKARIELNYDEASRVRVEEMKNGEKQAKVREARVPKPERKDPKLEAELKKVWESYSSGFKVLRVSIAQPDWESFVDERLAKKSRLRAYVVTHYKGTVNCGRVTFERSWSGGGWSAPKVSGIGENWDMLEENVHK